MRIFRSASLLIVHILTVSIKRNSKECVTKRVSHTKLPQCLSANTVMSSDFSQLRPEGFSLFKERARQKIKEAEPTQLKSPRVTKHMDSACANVQPGICICSEHMFVINQIQTLPCTHAS